MPWTNFICGLLIVPFMLSARRLGRPCRTDLREVMNALLYIVSTGCQWQMLLKDFPPYSTVQGYFYEWRATGLWTWINHHLIMEVRELGGKEASPTAGVIDSQSVKTTESGGIWGFDAGNGDNKGVGLSSRAASATSSLTHSD